MRHIYVWMATVFCLLTVSTAVNANEDRAFVEGFVSGATVTDEAIVKRLEMSGKEWSSFEERAFRTRLGRRDRAQPATYYADFCLPTNAKLDKVTSRLLTDIGDAKVDAMSVYAALKRLYPCAIGKAKK